MACDKLSLYGSFPTIVNAAFRRDRPVTSYPLAAVPFAEDGPGTEVLFFSFIPTLSELTQPAKIVHGIPRLPCQADGQGTVNRELAFYWLHAPESVRCPTESWRVKPPVKLRGDTSVSPCRKA